MRNLLFASVAITCLGLVFTAPNSLVLTTTPIPPPLPSPPTIPPFRIIDPGFQVDPGFNIPNWNQPKVDSEQPQEPPTEPIISQLDISTNISNRFAKTLVTSRVKNPETKSKEATFTVVLPEKAFISEFVMEIDDKSYKAYVKEKEEAKQIYDKAVQSGQSAGHVAVSARDSNRFTVSVNVEPKKKATFLLTYEELLERRNNQYELVLNIHPGQLVKDLNIEVFVNESRPIKFVRTPSLRSGNEISKYNEKLDPETDIQIINSTSAIAKFKPDESQQKEFAKELGVKESEGVAGQFVLQYDVERDPRGGEVLLQDGYFVHFLAPDDLEPLPKHVVFVLDTSGSMYGNKIKQLRDAMVSILDELREVDTFHIVEFNTFVYIWDVEKQERVYAKIENEKEPFEDLLKKEYPAAITATKEAIEKGKQVIQKLQDDSLTNILSSLETALHLVNLNLKKDKNEGKFRQPIVVFLTDGEPTVGISNTEEITKIITKINIEKDQVPIFSLSFGDGADRSFLRKLSLKNNGFSRHIYEAADSSLQLQEFYKQISSPLLSNVHFKYTSEVKEVTKQVFPIYFRGCEMVSAGRTEGLDLQFIIEGSDLNGTTILPSVVEAPVSSLERLWAYLTIKQKLEERELVDNKTELTKKALDLALKYSFVTDVSSLVVVKPNDTSAVNTEDASKSNSFHGGFAPMSISGARFGAPLMAGMPGIPGPPMINQGQVYFDPAPPMSIPQSALMCTGPGCYKQVSYDANFDSDSDSVPNMSGGAVSYPFYPTPVVDPPAPPLTARLPWLSSVLNSNNTLSIKGTLLELGEFDYFLGFYPCTGTPLNATESGMCSLLNSCTQVFSLLTDFQTYEKFACQVNNKFAGVCCPQSPPLPY